MATQAQIEANRRNAEKSTGPRTAEGKAASSANATYHGMTSVRVLLPSEDAAQYHEMRGTLIRQMCPVGLHELMMIDQMVQCYWRMQRAGAIETATLYGRLRNLKDENGVEDGPGERDENISNEEGLGMVIERNGKSFELMRRYEITLERSYYRAVTALEKAQAARRRLEKQIAKQDEAERGTSIEDTYAEASPYPPGRTAKPAIVAAASSTTKTGKSQFGFVSQEYIKLKKEFLDTALLVTQLPLK